MLYSHLKLWRSVDSILTPPSGVKVLSYPEDEINTDDVSDNKSKSKKPKPKLVTKKVAFTYYGENISFLEAYKYLGFKPNYIRFVFVPNVDRPAKILMPMSYRKSLMEIKLRAFRANPSTYSKLKSNCFIDITYPIDQLSEKFKISKYNVGRPLAMVTPLINHANHISSKTHDKALLYTVSLTDPIPGKLFRKKAFVFYRMLLQYNRKKIDSLPFDKLILALINPETNDVRYVMIYDKNYPLNLTRIRSILIKIKNKKVIDGKDVEDIVNDVMDESSINNLEDDEKKDKLRSVLRNYVSLNPSIVSQAQDIEEDDGAETDSTGINSFISSDEVISSSVLYHAIGDMDKANELGKKIDKLPTPEKKRIIDKYSSYIIPKQKPINTSRHPINQHIDLPILVDNQSPAHIFEKRKSDFKENLLDDMVDTFRTLEGKDIPFKVVGIEVKTKTTPASVINTTINDRYIITLQDNRGKKQVVHVDFPHLTDSGTFLINGQRKIVSNQLVTYPIFFFKPYTAKFTSSYSSITIYSKMLKNNSYLIMHMAGSKFPLILFLAYKLGFDKTMELFGISYNISTEKPPITSKYIQLPDKTYLAYTSKDESGDQLIVSFLYSMSSFNKTDFNIQSQEVWKNALEKYIGNRNCIYLLDQVWSNIVTPIEIKILESKGDPTEISKIIRYMSQEVVKGRVDDRNGLERQRVRTSEIFISLLQKQVHAAYNEYASKRLSGIDDAELYINPTKIFSEVVNSQNVNMLENINPVEELSSMIKLTPIGIGGIPDKAAVPLKALDSHSSYYGNIDPLETPDGPGIGIQQHLAIGANITNIRGMFAITDRNSTPPAATLSIGPSLIPFADSNDGCRVLMAAGQMKQAIPMERPEIPAIQTGYESLHTNLLSDSFLKRSPINGKVIAIENNLITILDDSSNKKHVVDISPVLLKSGQGKNGLSTFNPVISIGSRVKKNDIIAEGANVRNGMIINGINLLCSVMPWKGFNFEDGMVVSESAAKKFVSLHLEEQKVYLGPDDDVVDVVNLFDEVSKGDSLITYSNTTYDVETHKHLRSDGGKVVNIEIYSNVEEDQVPEKLRPAYEAYKKKYISLRGKYPHGTFREKEKDEKIEGIYIKFILQQSLSLTKGDKINNRHFNKGVISIIEKDENMPLTPWGERIEIIYSPLSIINRMNTGQLCEIHTGLISKELYKLIRTKPRAEFIKKLTEVLLLLDGTDNKKYSSDVLKRFKTCSDVEYDRIKSHIEQDTFFPLVFPPFKTPPRKNILEALKKLNLKDAYPLKLNEEFNNRTTEPVAVGYMYVLKLEHIAEKKIHSRSIGPYVQKTMTPTAGKKRSGAQSIGEYDLYSILGWNGKVLIDEFFGPLSADHVSKNELVSEIIQTGTTRYKETRTNPVRDLFAYMMLSLHLKSN